MTKFVTLLSAALILLTATELTAQVQLQEPLNPLESLRGWRSNEPFMTGEGIEAINTANGNLTLSVPLGQEYSVGPLLRYRFMAINNSDAWDHARIDCEYSSNPAACEAVFEPVSFAIPNPNSNAGLGWEVHLGRLYEPNPPTGLSNVEFQTWPNRGADVRDSFSRWLYVSPSGASHYLHELAGRGGAHYSKDGSQLRMVQVDTDPGNPVVEIHQPNGLISEFLRTNERAGTMACGTSAQTHCWRFHQTRDPYGNYVRVSYSPPGGNQEIWTVTDSTGRSHRIVFNIDTASTAGGDLETGQWADVHGNQMGDLRRVVDKVEVAASVGRIATYDFDYGVNRISRGCPHNLSIDGNESFPVSNNTIRVPILRGIDFPEGEGFTFEYDLPQASVCRPDSGRISAVNTPTQGRLEYTYGSWAFPNPCVFEVAPDAEIQGSRRGIKTKKVIDRLGAVEGVWSYSSTLLPGVDDEDLWGPTCKRPDYRKTVVVGPTSQERYTKNVFFHAVHQGPEHPSDTAPIDDWQITDNGLPYSKHLRIGSGDDARFLSEEIWDCPVGGTCTKKRSKYVRYEMGYRHCARTRRLMDTPGCYQINPRRTAERTVFHTDGNRFIERQWVLWDGVGNPRREIVRDSFPGNPAPVITVTDYTTTDESFAHDPRTGYIDFGTPTDYLPATTERWILHPYRKRTVTDSGRSYVTEAQFNDKGSLTCTRNWKFGARSGQDLVRFRDLNEQGLPARTIVAGGDGASLGLSQLCLLTGSAAAGTKFITTNTFEDLTLASSQIAGFPFSYRADIDRNTGLESAVYNPQDQKTSLFYDRLGRIKTVLPDASLRQARTDVLYVNNPGKAPEVRISLSENGQKLDQLRQFFDHRGRLYRQVVRRPSGQVPWTDSAMSATRRLWDAYGNLLKLHTQQPQGTPPNWSHATAYANYDPFGRPGRITRPDGEQETLTYQGVRRSTSRVRVRTSETAFSDVTTARTFDNLGREVTMTTPSYMLARTYDPDGKVVSATRSAGAQSQTREFGWDHRGFLVSETLPEVGSGTGNGVVSYTRDALGNIRTRSDGLHNLSFQYDNAGRLVRTLEGTRLWQEQVWGSSTTFGDYNKGKLVRAVRHNHPLPGEQWTIDESYEYRGRLGGLSHKTWQFRNPDENGNATDRARFLQSFEYDALGQRIGTTYPSCVPTPGGEQYCNGPGDIPGPAHTAETVFNVGSPVRVSSSLGVVEATYTYHANSQLALADYANGTQTAFDMGTAGMPRPQRIHTHRTSGNGLLFDTGIYQYDGAGNIWAMGDDRFTYDGAGRLLSGTVKQHDAASREDYAYDPFDNLTGVRRDSGPWRNLRIDAKNRVLGALGGPIDTSYDAAGNMIAKGQGASGPQAQAMEYDAFGMQTRFTLDPGSPEAKDYWYVYGPGNYRAMIFDPSNRRRIFHLRDLDGKLLRQYTVVGWGPPTAGDNGEEWKFNKDYLYGADGMFATVGLGNVPRYFHRDHLGSTRMITASGSQIAYEAAFYPYGDEVVISGTGPEQTSKFTGHERDLNGRTDYMLGRTYHLAYHRFASVDPARDGWNLYGYVRGNPLGLTDPSGLMSDCPDDVCNRPMFQELPEIQTPEVAVTVSGGIQTKVLATQSRVGLAAEIDPFSGRITNIGVTGEIKATASSGGSKLPVKLEAGESSATISGSFAGRGAFGKLQAGPLESGMSASGQGQMGPIKLSQNLAGGEIKPSITSDVSSTSFAVKAGGSITLRDVANLPIKAYNGLAKALNIVYDKATGRSGLVGAFDG